MAFADDSMERGRLEALSILLDWSFGGIGSCLKRREQSESFALYAYDIVGEGERKSVEPIAVRATATPQGM